MSNREFEEKRAKNQCFYCDEKYFPGHKCAAQGYGLEVLGQDSPQEEEELEGGSKIMEEEIMGVQEEPLQLSLSAVNGANSYLKNNPLHILLDSGSTHNFLDISTAKRLHCEIKRIPPLQVMVAGGQQLQCSSMYKDFEWSIMGRKFSTDVMLITLGSYEMILGVQWLARLGPIFWDFGKLRIEFMYEGQKVVPRGTQKADMEWLGSKSLQQNVHRSASSLP